MFMQTLVLYGRQKEASVKCEYEPGYRNNAAFKLANKHVLTTRALTSMNSLHHC